MFHSLYFPQTFLARELNVLTSGKLSAEAVDLSLVTPGS